MRKAISLLLALTLSLLGLPLFAAAEASPAGFPIVAEPLTFTAYATSGPYTKGDFNDLKIWKYMEDLTNIKIQFEAAPSAQSAEKLGLLFASNNLPDIIFKTLINNADVTNYAAEGQIIPIDGLLAEYAPNFSKLLNDTPEIRKAITMADGHIYGFPYIVSAAPSTISPKPFYNAKWAEKAGFQAPDTLDQLTEQLRAFKTSDWNGNGVADEIPLSGQTFANLIIAFYGPFGLCTRGSAVGSGSDVQEWDIGPDGNLRYIPAADGYKQMLQYLSGLYTEGLLDQEIFTNELSTFQAKADQNRIGFGFVHNNNYMAAYKDDFLGLPAPLTGPTGEKLYSGALLTVTNGNTFVTSACKNPAAAVQYFDYFYSDKGITTYFMGIEGETYEYGADGNPVFTDYVKKNPDGMNMEEALGTYVCWSGGGNPSVADDLHFGVHLIPEITVTAAKNMQPYVPETLWPGSFTYTEAENEKLVDLRTDILTYVKDMRAKFISGSESFDNWDAYIATLNRMGLADYQAIVQTGMERYNAMD